MLDRYQTYFLVPPDAFRIAAQTLPRSEFASSATRYFVGSRKKKRGQSDGAFSGDSSTCQLYTIFCAPTRLYRVVGKKRRFFRRLRWLLHRSLSWPLLKMNNYRRTIYRKYSCRSVRNIRHLRYWFWRYVSSLGKLHLLPISF